MAGNEPVRAYDATEDDVELSHPDLDVTQIVPQGAVDGWKAAGWVVVPKSKRTDTKEG